MRAQVYGYKRRNYSFRVAHWPDCQRIQHCPNLPNLVHGWAKIHISNLSAPALKVLSFLAALNRTGKTGYVGFCVAYGILAPQIAAATWSKFSKRSLERGIHDLKAAGLIKVQKFTRPGQMFRAGGKNVVMSEAGTVTLSSGAVVVRQLAIVSLTDAALAMWEQGKGDVTGKKAARNLPVSKGATPAKLATSSPRSEQFAKPNMLHGDAVTSDSVNVSQQEGRPTRPSPQAPPAPPTVEHQASSSPPSAPAPKTAASSAKASNEASRPAQRPTKNHAKGPGVLRPADRGPRGDILRCIWDILQGFSRRQASSLYHRAHWELSQHTEGGVTAVDWSYWASVWPRLSPQERIVRVMREMLPLLKQNPHFPDHQLKVRAALIPVPADDEKPPALDPFLSSLAGRLGLKF